MRLIARSAAKSVRGRLVFRHVHLLPLAVLDPRADLRGGFALARLLVGIKTFADTNIAARRMFAGKAIEQAAVSLAAVAMAIARLLIQDFLDAHGNGIRVLHHDAGEQRGTERRGKRPWWKGGMKCGHGFERGVLRLTRSGARKER